MAAAASGKPAIFSMRFSVRPGGTERQSSRWPKVSCVA